MHRFALEHAQHEAAFREQLEQLRARFEQERRDILARHKAVLREEMQQQRLQEMHSQNRMMMLSQLHEQQRRDLEMQQMQQLQRATMTPIGAARMAPPPPFFALAGAASPRGGVLGMGGGRPFAPPLLPPPPPMLPSRLVHQPTSPRLAMPISALGIGHHLMSPSASAAQRPPLRPSPAPYGARGTASATPTNHGASRATAPSQQLPARE